MIAYFFMLFIIWIVGVFTGPLLLFPDVAIPSGLLASIATAGTYVSGFGFILPLDALFSTLAAYLAIEAGIFAYKGVRWIYQKFPGIS